MDAAIDPHWPDKIMEAAMFVTLGGLMATAYAGLHLAGASFNADSTWFAAYIPPMWALATGLAALAAGVYGYIRQIWLPVVVGILLDIVSFGMLGAASLLGVMAVWPLLNAWREHEDAHLHHRRMPAQDWPDKALIGGVMYAAAGAITCLGGLLVASGVMTSPLPFVPSAVAGAATILAGIAGLAAGREMHFRRRAWLAWIAGIAMVLAAGMYVVGPLLAVAGLVYLALAEHESEFLDDVITA